MESLVAYGSDDDCDDVQPKAYQSSSIDANYEEVQMDLSEESNDSSKPVSRRQSYEHSHSKSKDSRSDRRDERDKYKYKYEHGHSSPKREDKSRDRYRNDEREKDERSRDYRRDRSRDKSKYRDDRNRESRKSRDEQDRCRESHDNGRDDRRTYRASSRDRHRSRSPRRSEYKRRSSSRDRSRSGYSKRYDRANKMDRLEKLGIEIGSNNSNHAATSSSQHNDTEQNRDRFYMPGITGRFTEQIQQRKLLWQKKDPKITVAPATAQPSGKVWQNTTFAQDTDGKVANKFKRLMGIKANQDQLNKPINDTLKRQEEMFNSMEAQYEVARTATHTMRGVGLGFGSFQR